ncbi:hypothetical protein Sinac_4000 [Singulisphaera acidiphila DSM 18658]|uniref:Uncharacterized protein n=1 Tax=Singulisphaera acidiphila (strain ATCC BAA-1392 / DSM 18658 / VKM B-2454 / MOB10) TaxID=886293 RepID=L0DHD2_SINAD|nr:hypothetical protein Sinac_4000 [Singulisphaera acidiphila DSM 18658]
MYRVAYEWVLAHRIDPGLIRRFVDVALGGQRDASTTRETTWTSMTHLSRWPMSRSLPSTLKRLEGR